MIDVSSLGIPPSEEAEFKELCNKIYRFVANEEYANLFIVMKEFPSDMYPLFETALDVLISNSCIINGSKGFKIANPLEFEETDNSEDDVMDLENCIQLERAEYNREIDSNVCEILSDNAFFDPINIVEKTINSMDRGTTKTILNSFFIEETDIDILTKTYKSNAEKVISKFSHQFSMDPIDVDLFGKYNLPANVFTYLFNRSSAYYRLFSVNFDPGYGDISDLIFPFVKGDALYISRTPNSDEKINICARAMAFVRNYLSLYGNSPKNFISAILGLLDNTSIKKTRVKEIFEQYSGANSSKYPARDELLSIFDYFIEADEYVKHLTHDNIQAVCSIIANIDDLDYGISVKKMYNKYKGEFNAYYINTQQELHDFILKYTPYRIYKEHVIVRGTLKDALRSFMTDVKIYDRTRLANTYKKRCGDPSRLIDSLVQTIDVDLFANKNPLTEEEEIALSAKFSNYEWITQDNAKSIFADLHDIEDKFTEMNMHVLGFTSLRDVYYRRKYPSFRDCILNNEFVGDDIYVDDRQFRLKMESRDFATTVEYFERCLQWIPVSKDKYLNLNSPRYSAFAKILRSYKDKIIELCKHRFVTPFSLKNTKIGIPEIDDDYFDLEFYDAMLIASKAKHQTFAKQRFYFIPSDLTSFNPTAPEFIRYLVYNNDGSASVEEIQIILESEYGIYAQLGVIRNQIKLSTCIFDIVTDTAYLDEEMIEEAIRNG